jgi:hypothetical protein
MGKEETYLTLILLKSSDLNSFNKCGAIDIAFKQSITILKLQPSTWFRFESMSSTGYISKTEVENEPETFISKLTGR